MVIERVDTQFRENFPENWLFWLLSGFEAVFFSTLIIILNKHLVIMSNNKTGKNLIFRSSYIFEDGSEQTQNPGHA